MYCAQIMEREIRNVHIWTVSMSMRLIKYYNIIWWTGHRWYVKGDVIFYKIKTTIVVTQKIEKTHYL